MAYEPKPGSGGLFKNLRKSGAQPDYKGLIVTPSGEKLEIVGWLKDFSDGKFLSLKLSEPRDYPAKD